MLPWSLHALTEWLTARLHGLFSLGTLEAVSDAGGDNEEALLGEVEETLASTSYGAKFSTLIEDRFKRSTAKPRGRLFVRSALAGVLIYNLFLVVDLAVVPDVIWLAVPLQLGFVTPIIVAYMVVITRYGVDPELPSFICVTIMLAVTIGLFMVSRSPHVSAFACLFGLFLISGNVTLAMGFASSLAFSILCVAAVAPAILLHPSLDPPERLFAVALLVSTATYSLAGSYRVEAGLRSAYLFALRESLRARLLDRSNRKLKTLVTIDSLTGIGNRRHLDDTLASLWNEAPRTRPIAFLIIDIDLFKRFNDTHGHQAGDECLRQVAQTLAAAITTPWATVARYGGEEFAIVAPGLAITRATALAETLRRTVERRAIHVDGGSMSVTISIGCAAATPLPGADPSGLIAAADAALYEAKRAGRNRVGVAAVDALDTPRAHLLPLPRAAVR